MGSRFSMQVKIGPGLGDGMPNGAGRLNCFALGCALLAVLWSVPVASAAERDQSETGCPPAQLPSFVAGSDFATLKSRLGPAMGEPLTCVAADPASGDAMQWTSTGLAVYRKAGALATFTNGVQHWALTTKSAGIVEWEGGSIVPAALPQATRPASLPPDDHGVAYCGVDVMTHFSAHVDLATGQVDSTSTSIGGAEHCFDTHFHACTSASMTTYLVIAAYRTDIVGPADDGLCRVISSFPDNPNPKVVGQEMTCDLDPGLPFAEAAHDRSRCEGALFDTIWGDQDAR